MIIDLSKFITNERPVWSELEHLLDRLENNDPQTRLPLPRSSGSTNSTNALPPIWPA